MKQGVIAAWTKKRKAPGVMCDRKILRKLKCKTYKTIVKLYGAKQWTVKKKMGNLLRITEMRMLCWIRKMFLGGRLMNEKIRKKYAAMGTVEKLREVSLR